MGLHQLGNFHHVNTVFFKHRFQGIVTVDVPTVVRHLKVLRFNVDPSMGIAERGQEWLVLGVFCYVGMGPEKREGVTYIPLVMFARLAVDSPRTFANCVETCISF